MVLPLSPLVSGIVPLSIGTVGIIDGASDQSSLILTGAFSPLRLLFT